MPNWFKDNSQSIDHTLMVRLNRITDDAPATVLGKLKAAISHTLLNVVLAQR